MPTAAAVRLIAWVAVLLVGPGLQPAAGAEAPAKLKTRTLTIHRVRDGRSVYSPSDVQVELVQLPPGKVTLRGPDGKDREFEVKPIWMARYETRWDEYYAFAGGYDLTQEQWHAEQRDWKQWQATRVHPPEYPPHAGRGDMGSGFPADCVTLLAARKYCAWLSHHTGKKCRLPTEAEWEYACRAGGPPARPTAKELEKLAWFAGNSEEEPHPVGQKRPNAWGLYDMLGNVGEFVIRDPKDEKGLLAGGSWKDAAEDVRSGAREPYSPEWQKNDPQEPKDADWLDYGSAHHVGFRVVMEE